MAPDVAFHVGDVWALGGGSRGASAWDAYWASWRTLWPWPGSWSRLGSSVAGGGVAQRRRGGSRAILPIGRPNRARRQYLRRRAASLERRRRERGWAARDGRRL